MVGLVVLVVVGSSGGLNVLTIDLTTNKILFLSINLKLR